uniref:maturase K n=1 Tax=Taenitis blechnoides TaxID=32177 RepID=UPI002A81ED32|nr:maturase K [Taenitis blechnoides]WNR49172.1 maturase K [Taenitis blechnoides]
MKATYGSFAKIDASQKNDEFDNIRDCFLYPSFLLFDENFYFVNGKQRSKGPDIHLISGSWSTVAIKRLIDNVRDFNYLKTDNSGFVRNQMDNLDRNLYLQSLLRMMCLALGVSLLNQISNQTKSILKTSQSIHLIFLFLEDRFPKSNYVLKTNLPQNIHLETLIRLFRRQIQDVLFLHLLRIIYYRDKSLCRRTAKEKRKSGIDTLLRNFYIYNIDLLLLGPWKQARVNHSISIDRYNITQKARYVPTYSFESNMLSTDFSFNQGLCVHYVRYKKDFIIASRGTCYFVRKWFYYFSVLLKQNFYYITRFDQVHLELLSVSCVSFMGYTSIAQFVSKYVRVETVTDLRISILNEERFYPNIPFLIIIKLLAKQHFCESNGRPIGKSAWTVLTDDEILDRFVQLWQVFLLYYGASTSRGKLRKLRYILQISCGSTLSSKHGGIAHHILRRKFNLDIRNHFLLSNKLESLKNQRFWRLSLIRSVLTKFVQLKILDLNSNKKI